MLNVEHRAALHTCTNRLSLVDVTLLYIFLYDFMLIIK